MSDHTICDCGGDKIRELGGPCSECCISDDCVLAFLCPCCIIAKSMEDAGEGTLCWNCCMFIGFGLK